MYRVILILALLSLLSACGRHSRPAHVAAIHTRKQIQSKQNKKAAANQRKNSQYKVKKGDTLYSIGFNFQMDYKFLAQINGINKPYRIYPGQTLKLKSDSKKSYVTKVPVTTSSNGSSNGAVTTKKLVTSPVITSSTIKAKPLAAPNKSTKQPASVANKNSKVVVKNSTPVIKPKPKPVGQKVSTAVKVPTKKTIVNPPILNSGAITWSWPTAGKIRSTFLASNPARKGISIGGKEGQAVKAAAPGVVVYSGSGLLGYGELIIVKHNDQFLSAYGHNKKRLVTEGDVIKKGQTIAELGSSGTNVNNLHFEIRRNGKPVNPLNYVKP